jgi:hypothetical protein
MPSTPSEAFTGNRINMALYGSNPARLVDLNVNLGHIAVLTPRDAAGSSSWRVKTRRDKKAW